MTLLLYTSTLSAIVCTASGPAMAAVQDAGQWFAC